MIDLLQRYYKIPYYTNTVKEFYAQSDYKKILEDVLRIKPEIKSGKCDSAFSANFNLFKDWAKDKNFVLDVNESLSMVKLSAANLEYWYGYDVESYDYVCHFSKRIYVTGDVTINGTHDEIIVSDYDNPNKPFNITLLTTVEDLMIELERRSFKPYGKGIRDIQIRINFESKQQQATDRFIQEKNRYECLDRRIEIHDMTAKYEYDVVLRPTQEEEYRYHQGYYDSKFAYDRGLESRISSGMYGC